MSTQKFSNNFKTTLAQSLEPEDTSIYLTTTSGLPIITPVDEFHKVTLKGPLEDQIEICDVTNVDYNNHILTVVRGVEGTIPLKLDVGELISLNLTAETLNGYASITDDLLERLAAIEAGLVQNASESVAGIIQLENETDALAEYGDSKVITPFTLKSIMDAQTDFGEMRQYTESTYVDTIAVDGAYVIDRANGSLHLIDIDPGVTSVDFAFTLNDGETLTIQLTNAENIVATYPETIVWLNGVPSLDDKAILEIIKIDSVEYGAAVNTIAGEATPTFSEEVLLDSPYAYYRLDETSGTTASDSSGNSRNGTYSGLITLNQPGLMGEGNAAVLLNPSSDNSEIVLPFTTNFTTECTIEAVFNVDAAKIDDAQFIVSKNSYFASSVTDFPISLFYTSATDTISFGLSIGNDFSYDLVLSYAAAVNTNYHVVAVYRANGTCELWVNGVQQDSGTISGSISSNSRSWKIGAASFPNGGGVNEHRLGGIIDEFVIYNASLPSDRIQAHFAATGL